MALVSIVIPTHNRAHLLWDAVRAAYSQSLDDVQVVVSDNGSTDNTKDVLSDLRQRYARLTTVVHRPMLPIHRHWDQVIRGSCTGKYLMVIPDDDRLTDPSYLVKVLRLFEKYRNVGIVFANYTIVNKGTNERLPIRAKFHEMIEGKWFFRNYNKKMFGIQGIGIPHLTAVFSRESYIRVGGFDHRCLSPDTYLWLKLLLHYDAAFVDELVAEYMIHEGNLSGHATLKERYGDTSIASSVRRFAIETDKYDRSIGQALKRIEAIFSRRFSSVVFSRLRAGDLRVIAWLPRVQWVYFFSEIVHKLYRQHKRILLLWPFGNMT